MTTFLGILTILFFVLSIFLMIIVRGATKSSDLLLGEYKFDMLTGVQREEMRRRIMATGSLLNVSPKEIMDLLYCFRLAELGQYSDEDPFIPSGEYAYEDIEEFIRGKE